MNTVPRGGAIAMSTPVAPTSALAPINATTIRRFMVFLLIAGQHASAGKPPAFNAALSLGSWTRKTALNRPADGAWHIGGNRHAKHFDFRHRHRSHLPALRLSRR